MPDHLSIIVPCFNEEKNLGTLHARLTKVLEGCGVEHRLVLVDDGSRDGTLAGLRELAARDARVTYISFSRNFGQEAAVAAGLDKAAELFEEGHRHAAVLMDADLQDPPELIGEMVERWRAGAHVVYAQRKSRRGDPLIKRACIYLFYRFLARISDTEIPLDTGNFRLMDRKVVEVVRACRENPRYVRGLVPWAGFRQEPVLFDRDPRFAGATGYGPVKLVKLALGGIFAFSQAPLRMSAWLGAAVMLLSALLTLVVVVDKLWLHPDVPKGFAFLACAIFFMGGVQLFMLGMLAHYVGYIVKNVQGRPMYVVAEASGGGVERAERDQRPEVVVRDGVALGHAGGRSRG